MPADRLVAAFRRISDRDDPEKFLTFVDAANLAEARHGTLVAAGSYTPPKGIGGTYKGAGVGPSPAYSFQACVAEVTVDTETGVLTVDKLSLAHDCGRAINPANVEGQIEGAAYMGYGEAVVEEQVFRGGLHKKPSLLEYKLPTSLDTPELKALIIETIDAEGLRREGGGRGPAQPAIPAIANAVFDAIGVRIDETPITPEDPRRARQARQPRPEEGPHRADRPRRRKGDQARVQRLAATTAGRERGRGARAPRQPTGREQARRRACAPLHAHARRGAHGARPRRSSGRRARDARRRRHRPLPEHEAPPGNAVHARLAREGPRPRRDPQRHRSAIARSRRSRPSSPQRCATATPRSRPPPRSSRRRSFGTWARSAATSASTPGATVRPVGVLARGRGLLHEDERRVVCRVARRAAAASRSRAPTRSPRSSSSARRFGSPARSASARADLGELYREDGIRYSRSRRGRSSPRSSPPTDGWRSTYLKMRDRGSFDFPIAGVAAAIRMEGGRWLRRASRSPRSARSPSSWPRRRRDRRHRARRRGDRRRRGRVPQGRAADGQHTSGSISQRKRAARPHRALREAARALAKEPTEEEALTMTRCARAPGAWSVGARTRLHMGVARDRARSQCRRALRRREAPRRRRRPAAPRAHRLLPLERRVDAVVVVLGPDADRLKPRCPPSATGACR